MLGELVVEFERRTDDRASRVMGRRLAIVMEDILYVYTDIVCTDIGLAVIRRKMLERKKGSFFFFFLLGKKTKPGRTLQVLLFAGLNKRNSDTLKVT